MYMYNVLLHIHVHVVLHVHVLGLGQRLQNSFVSKNERIFEGSHVFVSLTFNGYRIPPKLDYCFITSTSLFAVSTWI